MLWFAATGAQVNMIKVIQEFVYFYALSLIDFCYAKSSVKDLRISKQSRKRLQAVVFHEIFVMVVLNFISV